MSDRDDPVERLRRAVARREPVDEREAESVAVLLAELDRLAHPFDRESDPVHVTGSAVIVGPRGVVLLLHRRLGIWVQPGGHVDPGETPWEAARREAEEETGLVVDFAAFDGDGEPALVHVDVHPAAHGHVHLDARYLFSSDDRDPAPPPDESQHVRWFDWDEALRLADPGLVGLLRQLAPS